MTLYISGSVMSVAKIDPTYARLAGQAGTDIEKTVTILPEKAYAFKIVKATAKNGHDIDVEIKPGRVHDASAYFLTIKNKKRDPGRYADSVILKTDSTIKPVITIPVYGHIIEKPQKASD